MVRIILDHAAILEVLIINILVWTGDCKVLVSTKIHNPVGVSKNICLFSFSIKNLYLNMDGLEFIKNLTSGLFIPFECEMWIKGQHYRSPWHVQLSSISYPYAVNHYQLCKLLCLVQLIQGYQQPSKLNHLKWNLEFFLEFWKPFLNPSLNRLKATKKDRSS